MGLSKLIVNRKWSSHYIWSFYRILHWNCIDIYNNENGDRINNSGEQLTNKEIVNIHDRSLDSVLENNVKNTSKTSKHLFEYNGLPFNRSINLLSLHSRIIHKLPLSRQYSSEAASSKDDHCNHQGGDSQTVDASKDSLVLAVYQEKGRLELSPAAQEADQKSGGKITRQLNELSGEMKLGKAFVVTDVLPEFGAVALSSLGPKDPPYDKLEELDEARENMRWCAGAGVRALRRRGATRVLVDAPAPLADAAAEGAELAAWRFDELRTQSVKAPPALAPLAAEAGGAWGAGALRARGQNWARWLCDMPANRMLPTDVARAALDALCPLGVDVRVHERDWATVRGMRALAAVAQGSCHPPLVLECSYDGPDADGAPVLVVAKGITFDSGGICLKRPEDMLENRGSMAGAAVALAALKILAELKARVRVRCVIPLCENMISGQCMRVGDVLRTLNGLSVSVEDTDLEGRLVMADALVYGQTQHRPALVVDVATLTRGVALATGGGACGCFTNCEALWESVRSAGAWTGDRAWRFPLWRYYDAQLTDDAAVDLRNRGSGTASPCLGAAFLRHFVCGDWLHLDVAGVARLAHEDDAPPYLRAQRMAARPTRTLAHVLANLTPQ